MGFAPEPPLASGDGSPAFPGLHPRRRHRRRQTGGANGGASNQPCADIHGNITGTTQVDGIVGDKTASGTLFSLPRAGTLTTLYTFTAATGGTNPMGVMTAGAAGVFYGVIEDSGTALCKRSDGSIVSYIGCGTIWKYTP